MIDACELEITELHQFFQEWFAGSLSTDDAAFARFAQVMAADFQMVTPGGVRLERKPLLDGLRAAHGSQPKCKIWVQNIAGRMLPEGLCLVTYEEWQGHGSAQRGRLSSALFRSAPDAPHGVEWVHLHEVWLPVQNGDQADAR